MTAPPLVVDPLDEHLHARLVARVRGFDLGDDVALLAWLVPLWRDGHLAPEQRWVLAALAMRRGDFRVADEVLRVLVRSEEGEGRDEARYLRAWARFLAGRSSDALRLLAKVRDGVPEPWRLHSEGQFLEARGELESAAGLMMLGVVLDGSEPVRWRDLGHLCTVMGDHRGAQEAWTQVLAARPLDPEASYERAASLAALGHTTQAEVALRATTLWGELAARARDDERVACLGMDALFEAAAPRAKRLNRGWLRRLPGEVARVAADKRVWRAGLRFVPLERALQHRRQEDAKYGATTRPPGLVWPDAVWEMSQADAARQVLVAEGPHLLDRDGIGHPLLWYVDRERGGLWLSLGSEMPAALRIPAGHTADEVLTALDHHCRTSWPSRAGSTRMVRARAGRMGEITVPQPDGTPNRQALPHALARHFATSPVVDGYRWGSSRQEDPWPVRIPAQVDLVGKVMRYQDEVQRQAEGGRTSYSRRTVFTGSILTLELHRATWVWEVRHAGGHADAVITRINDLLGTSYPTDLPVDVLAAVMGFEWSTPTMIAETARAGHEDLSDVLDDLAAVTSDGLDGPRWLRSWLDDPDPAVRDAVVRIAVRYNWEFLVEDALLAEPDETRRASLRRWLDAGIAPPAHDEFGDPVGSVR